MEHPTEAEREHISDYERAVCYYALSRPSAGVTLALILVYTLCLLEALFALVYGLVTGNATWTTVGTYALGGIILFGVVVFTLRSLFAEIQRRRTLAIVRQAPDLEAVKGLPDPFADHTLLRRPLDEGESGYDITDRDGGTLYTVRLEEDGAVRRVFDASGVEQFLVRIPVFARSFNLEGMMPRRAEVYAGSEPVARIRQRFTLGPAAVEITEGRGPDARRYSIREGGVYQGTRLIGRIYLLRSAAFLDVETAAMSNALLGLFVSLSYEKAHTALL